MTEAVFVQGTDYNYYRNPVFYGDKWFVNFEDDELPEIVVRQFRKTSKDSAIRRMRKILNDHGFKYKMTGNVGNSERVFPPKWEGFDKAISGHFELLDMVPIEKVKVHEQGILILKPEADGTYFTFYDPFDIEEIRDLLILKPSQKLITWLTGLEYFSPQTIASARKELFKQHPGLDTIGKKLIYLKRKIR